MTVNQLIEQLQGCLEIWPEIADMRVTAEGRDFDLVIPCNPDGLGPVTDAGDPVGGVDLSDSGLTASDFERHG